MYAMTAYDASLPEIEAIFGTLTEEDRETLSVIHYAAGDPLMEENTFDDSAFFYILRGVAEGKRIFTDDTNDSMCYVPIKIKKGDFVGVFEALQNGPKRREIGVFAKSDVTALKVTQAQLYRWINRDSEVLNRIVQKLLAIAWRQRDVISCTNTNSTQIRFAYQLRYLYGLYLHSCYDEGYTGSVRILDTRQDMSIATGCSVRTIDRIVSQFKTKGLISIRRGKIYINDSQQHTLTEYIIAGM